MPVDCIHLRLVEQFDPRDRNPELNRRDHRLHRTVHRFEGADRRRHSLGERMQSQGHFRNHAERAFRPNEQPCQVVPGGGLSRTRAGLDHLAVSRHHL
jgi:hypothetical protein